MREHVEWILGCLMFYWLDACGMDINSYKSLKDNRNLEKEENHTNET